MSDFLPSRFKLITLGSLILLVFIKGSILAQAPLHHDRGIALIWYGNQENLDSRGGIVTTGQIFYMWRWFEPEEGKYAFEDLDARLRQIHSKGMKTVIQINGNRHPDYLYKIVPYLKDIQYPTAEDHLDGFGPLMYWHPVYKEKYRNMIMALAGHLKKSPYRDAVLGIRHNYNAIGTEHHYIRPEHREQTHWTLEEDASWGDKWPWTQGIADNYKTWTIDMYIEAFNPHEDINVFLRACAVSGGTARPEHLSMVDNGDLFLFHTSSEPQPRNPGFESQYKVFIDYCKTGKTLGFMESWSSATTGSDAWDWKKTGYPITKSQFNYWTLLCNLHSGVTFLAMRSGDVDYPDFRADYEFSGRYAGYAAHPEVSPGAWIAFREGDYLKGDYTFLMERHSDDNSKPLYNVDTTRYGLWARKIDPSYPMKLLLDDDFASSLRDGANHVLTIRYKDEGTGHFEINAMGQTSRFNKEGTCDWKVATKNLGPDITGNHIEIKAIETSLIIHMVEITRQ